MLVYRTAVGYGLLSSRGRKPWRSFKDCFVSLAMTDKFSFCDFCGKQLKWWENIPAISYLIQGGKSRCCGKKLPILYPITEIITAVLFLLNFKFLILNLQTINNFSIYNLQNILMMLVSVAIIGFLVFSAVFDLKYMILPDFSTNSLIFLALVYKLLMGVDANLILADALWGVSLYGFFYFLHVLTKGKGMGFGDVKLAFVMGFFLGWPRAIVSLYTAFIVGAVAGIIVIVFFKKKRKNRLIPFGPFMILGIIVSWWWGDSIWNYFVKALY
ncbi:MAG: Type 4 prepilin-like proteins leader peptide-processing enzyme [Firmicutes bacterium ADurb.Bin419]|nr:MAG: Type 4 prepilin-like proteins leader peptide-processing enzyme [Firmicutes bacterium ADurb.Bin419]